MTLIDRFLTHELKVKRSTSGTYIKGRYVAGPEEVVVVCGSLQPSSARELKLPEEGNRLKQYWRLFSDQPVLLNSMATLSKGDKVEIDGEQYRAMSRMTWQNTDLDYFETILWREPSQKDDGSKPA